MPSPFLCSPVIWECLWMKTQIAKNNSFLQLYFKEKYDTQQTQNIVTMFVVRSQRRTNSAYSRYYTLMPQRQNCKVASTLPRCWIVSSCPNKPWMLYWQRCHNVEVAMSHLQHLLNVDLTTSNSSFSSQQAPNVAMATLL